MVDIPDICFRETHVKLKLMKISPIAIALVGGLFVACNPFASSQEIVKTNNAESIHIAASFQQDSGIVKFAYLNSKLEDIEFILTPDNKEHTIVGDSVMLLTLINRDLSPKQFLAYKGDSILVADSSLTLLSSQKTNINRWVTINEFTKFYITHYPRVFKQIDSIINLLYVKQQVGSSGIYSLKEKDTVGVKRKKILYTSLNAAMDERIQEYTSILDSLMKEGVFDENYKQWQLFNAKTFSLNYLQQIQFELKNDYEAVAVINKLDLDEHEAVLSAFPSYKKIIAFYGVQSLSRLYQPPMQNGKFVRDDYTKIYDSIPRYFANLYPEHIKFECLKQIKESGTSKQFEQYASKFYAEAKDTNLINYVKNNLDIVNNTNTDLLLSNDGKSSISFDSLIKAQMGHLVYVDFWASWCAPCIAEMPASRALKAEYEKKEVRFIYLSIDKDFSKWKVASENVGLHENLQSFLLVGNEAGIINNFKIFSIPRYLLYDKSGKIIHENAPGPGSEEIRMLLDGAPIQ